ncbi:protein kinase C-binding protein 1 [Copidosoma floridanum]|uniref:protein kinase C-binding protein 1 n=1 Tax=Copidosoma floridanum TaxID=29053 RepID=UPI0006C94017|nr:protein kinase C-binding protein 1 [Copidosoma floridanum]XP_014218141.1 protein kinase C-binding protein 1 [Copidosoma floridanum]
MLEQELSSNMDSNESSEDIIMDKANKMEVSDSAVQYKNDEQGTNQVSSNKVLLEEHNKIEDVSSSCAETNETEGDLLLLTKENEDDAKINTLQTDSKVEQPKQVDNEKPNSVASLDKDSDSSDMDALELKSVSSETPKFDESNKEFEYPVINKNVESTKDEMDIEPNNQGDNDTPRSQSDKTAENTLKDDNKNMEDVKVAENIKSTEKTENTSTNDVEDTKDVKEAIPVEANEMQDAKSLDSTVDTKSPEDVKEIQSTVDSSNVKDIKENTDPVKIKRVKRSVISAIAKKETAKENVAEAKEVEKSEENKDIEATEGVENKVTITVKNNKFFFKYMKNTKETKDLANDKNTKETDSVNTSINTREGKRKRKSTVLSSEQSSPAVEKQQQNGSPLKRKRAATVASATVAEPVQTPTPEKPAVVEELKKNDKYCWRCHKESVEMQCTTCPRSWHRRCMGGAPPLSVIDWECSECVGISQAESAENRLITMAQLTPEQLVVMLKHVVQRMRDQTGSQPFLKEVDPDDVPNYLDYVVNPMDLSLLESNVRAKKYASTDAFMADARWIQHNCIVFNTYSSKLTNTAKQMLKVAKQEVSEIEACPDCFAHGRNLPRPLPSWFIEPCRRPHPIVWAKLKGFPFWPAKAMPRLNAQGLVDVRFFGEHDRAWVSPKDIYLYSKEPPAGTPRKKKIEMDQCMKEVQDHVKKLERVFGEFKYSLQKVQYDPHDLKQIQILLPNYDPLENKVNKKENPKTEVQTLAVKNKVTPAKAEKKMPNLKNTVTPSSNGLTANIRPTSERRKVLRKKRLLSPELQEPSSVPNKTSRLSSEMEAVVLIPPKKSKSKSPPAPVATTTPTTPTANNASSNNNNNDKNNPNNNKDNDNNDQSSSKDVKKSTTSTPEVTTPKLDVSSTKNNIPKPILVPVRKIRQPVLKKIKLTKESPKLDESMRKPMVVVKTMNSLKPTTIIHNLPSLNNFPDNLEATPVKILGTGKKLVSILPKKNPTIPTKVLNSKTIQVIQQDGKIVNRTIKTINMPVTKEAAKFSVISAIQPKDKSDLTSNSNNKPMTTMPLISKKEQMAILEEFSSSVSEPMKHFNNQAEKEIRLNTAVTIIKQEPKDEVSSLHPSIQPAQPKLTIVRKPSKARKSFSNKTPQFPQHSAQSLTRPNSSAANDSLVHISTKQNNDTRCTPSAGTFNSSASSAIVSTTSSINTAYELPPPEAGPLTAQIHRHSRELVNKMAQLIADTVRDAAESNAVAAGGIANHHDATIHHLKLKIERMKWEHEQEINELKHSQEQKLREMKASLEIEHHRALENAHREAEIDKRRCVEETKRKQWCVVCGREAMFFCCWNTAYCDYPCQQKHWSAHVNNCAQKNPPSSQSSASSVTSTSQLQTQRHGTSNVAKHQVMPKLVNTKSQQQQSVPVMRKTSL